MSRANKKLLEAFTEWQKNNASEIVSDNNAEDTSHGGTNALLQIVAAALANQSASATSAIAEAYRNSFSTTSNRSDNRTDEDVNAVEGIKAMAPAFVINMKNVVAAEHAKFLDFLTQNNQIAWNGINNAQAQTTNMIQQLNTVNQAVADNFSNALAAKVRDLKQLSAQPFLFTETGPTDDDENE